MTDPDLKSMVIQRKFPHPPCEVGNVRDHDIGEGQFDAVRLTE